MVMSSEGCVSADWDAIENTMEVIHFMRGNIGFFFVFPPLSFSLACTNSTCHNSRRRIYDGLRHVCGMYPHNTEVGWNWQKKLEICTCTCME